MHTQAYAPSVAILAQGLKNLGSSLCTWFPPRALCISIFGVFVPSSSRAISLARLFTLFFLRNIGTASTSGATWSEVVRIWTLLAVPVHRLFYLTAQIQDTASECVLAECKLSGVYRVHLLFSWNVCSGRFTGNTLLGGCKLTQTYPN